MEWDEKISTRTRCAVFDFEWFSIREEGFCLGRDLGWFLVVIAASLHALDVSLPTVQAVVEPLEADLQWSE